MKKPIVIIGLAALVLSPKLQEIKERAEKFLACESYIVRTYEGKEQLIGVNCKLRTDYPIYYPVSGYKKVI